MLRDIIIHMAPCLGDKFSRQWSSHTEPDESFPGIIVFSSQHPFVHESGETLGRKSPAAVLLIYIGQEIAEPSVYHDRVELPATILDNPEEFNRELAQRIKNYLGDN